MTLILSGTNGLSDVDGSASTPAIRGTDSNTGIFFPAADTIAFAEGGAEVMRIDSSGNVGIGTSSPTVRLQVTSGSTGTLAVQSTGTSGQYPSSGSGLEFVAGSASAQDSIISYNRTSSSWRDLYLQANTLLLGTAGSERARIDTSGRLLLNTTTAFASGQNIQIGTGSLDIGTSYRANTNGNWAIAFYNPSTSIVGQIVINSGSTSYNSASDYRLKENVQPMTGALAKVAALKPCTYTWKADGTAGQGFIAHELQEVCPDAVSGEKDAVNEDGSIKPQGIDTSFLVATLTAAIQEQQALIESLTARIAALEAA